MTELRFAMITQMRAQGMTWDEIAREFHVKRGASIAQTYQHEVDRRKNGPIIRLLQKAARE